MKTIDISCDLGEGGGFDKQLMPLISSCNIACGGHIGDEHSVLETVHLAVENKVNVGAHPSYPDQKNFGRTSISLKAEDLKLSLHNQIDLVEEACRDLKAPLHHIKPHGALYNDMRKDRFIADLVLEVMIERNRELILFVPPGIKFSSKIPSFIKLWIEGFADRAYADDLTLLPRSHKNAVLQDPKFITSRLIKMIQQEKVVSNSSLEIHQKFDTFCVHGDTENALEITRKISEELSKLDLEINTQ